ncbi:MFS transporter [Serratia symbiotica]|uniref:MFS transporter n=2 Tax=Serratia symbiotica TaxID=138074 RepID=A0A068YZB1_9GAMM|nr:MFS transporter [Serratia symbiotica]MBF1996241.1 MFS transporter [Serratia symbiotica]MBQ0955587.1 MFS transporter [Serratia symbiotica]QLH61879.1 MFS transporter [Serratia symbiotica]QTP14850.1 MFS transporter [Serratia symbiotica]CDS56596.1 Arabinose efflux permease family protein [Serratia symbiotica]
MTLDITVVNIALPKISKDLLTNLAQLQWVMNGYTLSFAALLLLAGAISDRMGRRPIFLCGNGVFVLASLGCAMAPSINALIIARVLQGAGGAMVLGTALALIASACEGEPPQVRTSAVGLFAAGGAVSAATGPLIGGMLIQGASWPWLFAINTPVGLLIIFFTLRYVDEKPLPAPRYPLDVAGAVFVTLSLFSLNYAALNFSSDSAPYVCHALLIGLISAVLFLWIEGHRGDRALLHLRLFRIPTFLGAILLSFAGRIFSFGLLPFITLWLNGLLHYSVWHTGLILLSQSLAMVIAAGLSGPLSRLIPVRVLLAIGMFIVAIGLTMSSHVQINSDWLVILPLLLMQGVGADLTMPHLMDLAVSVVPAHQAGAASGTANTFFPLGTAVGIALFGLLLSHVIQQALPLSRLSASDISEPASALQAISNARFNVLTAVPGLQLQAQQAWVDALNLLFRVAAVTSVIAGLAALWLIRPAQPQPEQAQESA